MFTIIATCAQAWRKRRVTAGNCTYFSQKLTVSHAAERKEKDCLNCGTIVQGRYCHQCGQENIVPHETFWHMVKHFLYDITHFDSKLFDSIRYLVFRPGFLPGEYVKGRRASYLNPVKKYVFTSAVFFIVFFAFLGSGGTIRMNREAPLLEKDRLAYLEKAAARLKENPDDTAWQRAKAMLADPARNVTQGDMIPFMDQVFFIDLGGKQYKDRADYDAVQQALPEADRDGWLVRMVQYQNFHLQEKYKNDPLAGGNKMADIFLHRLPYLLFVSLPLFALILKILYSRRRQYYYADHGIFSIYHYIFTFILILVVMCIGRLVDFTGWDWLSYLMISLFLSGGLYLFLSMKRFYGQGWAKTIFKFILLNIGAALMLTFLFIVLLFFTVFQL